VLGVATTGRDHSLPDVTRVVGPCAHVLPIRVMDTGSAFREQLRHISHAVTAARTTSVTMHHLAAAPPGAGLGATPSLGAQFVFSYLDFRSLGQTSGQTLSFALDREGGDMEPPPIGTDLFFTARPDHDGLQFTLRSSADVMTSAELADLADTIRRDLLRVTGTPPSQPHSAATRRGLDAAIVGYLPAPADLIRAFGLTPSDTSREAIRSRVFPDGRARLLEELSTPLGSSGFVCLPIFADELAGRGSDALSHDAARAVACASDLGARCVSLAGMIPSHTAYGLGVVRQLDAGAARVSTGHAATAASVVKTVMAAMDQAHRDLGECTVAFIGIGSIGRSSLELLLSQAGSPKALVLCDVPSRSHHLATLARALTADGYPGPVTVTCWDSSLTAEVYGSDVIIAAVSGGQQTVDVDRLRPGTIVVDDSFPHCFDIGTARRRMARHGDILMLGGGLLTCGPVVRQLADGVLPQTQVPGVMGRRLPDTIASCQLESLLQARRPDRPVVQGLVTPALARTYWDELTRAGVRAAPLHLLEHAVTPAYVQAFGRF
jgi:predicted amino acid dehydrogenase